MMRPCVRIEKLAPFLRQRNILELEQYNYFVSQNVLDANHEIRKFNELVAILQRVGDIPGGECIRSLYLSLCDVYEQDDSASAQQHRTVALHLRKKGSYVAITSLLFFKITCIVFVLLPYCSSSAPEYIR